MDVMCAVLETSHQCIPLSAKNCSGSKKTASLPGWKKNVAPAKEDALFWHSVWLNAGRPNRGELYHVMCWTRNKYHYAVRKAKRVASSIESRKLLEASEAGDIALMTEMKRVLGRKDTGQTVPDCLDGKVTHGDILQKFKECYEELYNSAESEDATALIKVKLENMVKSDTPGSIHEIQKVTGRVVKEACSRMLPGKTDVTEGYTSDVFLHGPIVLF